MTHPNPFQAGGAQSEITPDRPTFLWGYPHTPRTSTGVHDPLFSSALYIKNEHTAVVMVANDIIFVPREVSDRARKRIATDLEIPPHHILITASHTHSGPGTVKQLFKKTDSVAPDPDPAYLQQLEDTIVDTARQAAASAVPATLWLAQADGGDLGTNRRDPAGPAIPEVPVILAKNAQDQTPIALMAVCSMHPTVMHEDSTLVSGDFPGLARRHLQQTLLAPDIPFVYHTGASGNQSPRHITRSNTFEEADRLGNILADNIKTALEQARPLEPTLAVDQEEIDLPVRDLPSAEDAARREASAKDKLEELRRQEAPRATVRTAEVDWFGAEKTLLLAKAAEDGRLRAAADAVMPARVRLISIGGLRLVCWPGEVFAEFALEVKAHHPDTHIVTLADGELIGYLVTQQAIDEGAYEAGNAVFASPESGNRLVKASLELLGRNPQPASAGAGR